jgi:hypothetical protein
MGKGKTAAFWVTAALVSCSLLLTVAPAGAQSRGLRAIRAAEMKKHLEFLAAREFRGRPAPSPEVDIASRYLALEARRLGLRPLLADGTYLQYFPVNIATLAREKSHVKLLTGAHEVVFGFPRAFCPGVRSAGEAGAVSGPLVFLGTHLSPPIADWARLSLPDLAGKIAVVVDAPPPPGPGQPPPGPGPLTSARTQLLRERGAVGLVTIIRPDRESNLARKGIEFDVAMSQSLSFPDVDTAFPDAAPASGQPTPPAQPRPLFLWVDVRHDAGAAILGLSPAELRGMFEAAASGRQVPARALDDRTLEISLEYDSVRSQTPNVVAWVEGTDPRLRGEYVVIGAHQDHLPPREGHIFPGADDNGSGSVAMLSLARAFVAQRPRRSVIFVWHTAEERGLIGAYYFVEHCPVPVEKISADLNLDMISRNDPGMIYLIGSNKLSTELDGAIRAANSRSSRLRLDATYESPLHPDRFFFRSDQLPYIRYGIPGVWFFCGTTADYHQETDLVERCDFVKMERVAKLVYLAAMDIGNRPRLLKLDVNPRVTRRGPENMKFDWRNPPPEPAGDRRPAERW